MTTAALIFSATCLVLGVLAYGLAGARLSTGSQSEQGALHSRDWWSGTGLQGAGFLLTLLARRSLPVLIVQACSSLGLAVTAAIQHLTGVHRLTRRGGAAVAAVVVGVGLIAIATVAGPAVAIRTSHQWLLAVCCAICVVGIPLAVKPVLSGVLSGLGFAYAAIGARLVMGDAQHPLWRFWELPLSSWVIGLLTGTGIVLGQLHLTRGLAKSTAPVVLAPMYLMETLVPLTVGVWLLDEIPRPGTTPLMVLGVVLAIGGSLALVRR